MHRSVSLAQHVTVVAVLLEGLLEGKVIIVSLMLTCSSSPLEQDLIAGVLNPFVIPSDITVFIPAAMTKMTYRKLGIFILKHNTWMPNMAKNYNVKVCYSV